MYDMNVIYVYYMFHLLYVMHLSTPTNYHACTFSANRFKLMYS